MRTGCCVLFGVVVGIASLFIFSVVDEAPGEKLLLTNSQRKPSQAVEHQQRQHTIERGFHLPARPSCSDDSSDDLCWIPGGVKGPTERAADDFMMAIVDRYTQRIRSTVTAEMLSGDVEDWQSLADLVLDLAKDFASHRQSTGSDCMFELLPHQKAACVLLAAVESVGGTGRRTWSDSYCRSYAPCLVWQRGLFNTTVTARRLEDVFTNLAADARGEGGGAFYSLLAGGPNEVLSNFVISELTNKEFAFFPDRMRAQEEELAKRSARLLRRQVTHPILEEGVKWAKGRNWWDETPTDLRPVFQGLDLQYDFDRHAITVRRNSGRDDQQEGGGGALVMPNLTPLQLLAVLYHRAKLLPPRVDADLPTAATKRLLNIVAFSGDSMNREVFMRLVHFLRYGGLESTNNKSPDDYPSQSRRQKEFHEPSQHHDMIYAVYETHDELTVLHSPMSDHRSDRTVAQFFQAIKQKVRLHRRGKLAHPPQVALLYVVYFWDPTTEWNRQDLVVDVKLLGEEFVKKFADVVVNASRRAVMAPSLNTTSSRNAAKGQTKDLQDQLLVGEVAREKRRHLGKRQIVLPVESHRPCIIRVNVPRLKITRELDVRQLLTGQVATPAAQQQQQQQALRRNRSHAPVATSTPPRPNSSSSHCPPDMVALAEQLRVHMVRQEHMKYAPRPVIPLREIGIGVAVHVQGNVFWEPEHYPELFQQVFLTSIALNSEVPELRDFPRRAIPDDDTDVYFMSASFSEPSEPFLRHLMIINQSDGNFSLGYGNESSGDTPQEEAVASLMPLEMKAENLLDEDEPNQQQQLTVAADDEDDEEMTLPTQQNTTTRPSGGAGHSSMDWLPVTASLLRGLTVPDANRQNLLKNIQIYRWFHALLKAREDRLKSLGPATSDSFRYIASVNMLELGKIQHLRFRQGDDKHLACRFAQVRDRRKFDLSFGYPSLFYLLSSGTAQRNSRSLGAARWGGARSFVEKREAANVTVFGVVHMLHRMFAHPESAGLRDALWNISGMADELRTVKEGNILLMGDVYEFGVLIHDDGERCLDDGNLFLLQSLAWDLLGKQSKRRSSSPAKP